jgi:predicted nucleotidyltransferase
MKDTSVVREQAAKYLARARQAAAAGQLALDHGDYLTAVNGDAIMIRLPVHLQTNEQAALVEFTTRLLQQPDIRVVSVRLFGSKARGDFGSDSDLDLLVILENADWIARDRVHLLAARVSLEHDVLINTHLLNRSGWVNMSRQRATLWRHVQRDGIPRLSEALSN